MATILQFPPAGEHRPRVRKAPPWLADGDKRTPEMALLCAMFCALSPADRLKVRWFLSELSEHGAWQADEALRIIGDN